MLLLVTIALVLVAAIALVIGFVSNQLPPIYISIACSFVAAVVLAMFSRLNRRRTAPVTGGGPAPLDTGPSMFERSSPATAPTATTPAIRGARAARIEPEEEEEEPVTAAMPQVRRPAGRTEPPSPEPEEEEELWPEDVVFPIEDYDDLRTAEILPLLEELDDDELEDVRDYEEDHRRRASILRRIDELLEGEEDMPVPPPAARPQPTTPPTAPPPSRRPAVDQREPAATPPPPPAPPRAEPVDVGSARGPEPARAGATPPPPAPSTTRPERQAEPAMADDNFPIADYGKLRVAEILPLLAELDPDELEMVAERERAGAKRTTVLNRINRLLRPEKVKSPTKPPPDGAGGTGGSARPTKASRPASQAPVRGPGGQPVEPESDN